jgi:hypothetical protein
MNRTRRDVLRAAAVAAASMTLDFPRGFGAASSGSPAPSPLDGVKIAPATLVGREGFWRVGKSTTGRWWLVRPDGRPFLYRGMVSVGPVNPPADDAAARSQGESPDKVAYWLGRLEALGFNGLGEWTSPAMYDRGWPYTLLIHVRKATANQWTVQPPKHIDIFDPKWRIAYDEKCRQIEPFQRRPADEDQSAPGRNSRRPD